jgi:hypothetical protein
MDGAKREMRDEMATDSVAERDPRSHYVMKRLHVIWDHAEQIRASAGTTADKIVGPTGPTKLNSPDEKGAAKPSGFFAEIDDVLSSIEKALSLAGDNLRRFEREF